MFDHHCRKLVFAGVFMLAWCFMLNAKARGPAQEIELPSLEGWEIQAVKRGNSVMCSARKKEKNGKEITLLANSGDKYRDGAWFLGVFSRNHRLEPNVEEAAAQLSLEGKRVVTGKVLAVGGWVGNERTATYVRFDFPAIDAYVKDIKAASVVELSWGEGQQDSRPLKLEPLRIIIAALEECQKESLRPSFWNNAKDVCN